MRGGLLLFFCFLALLPPTAVAGAPVVPEPPALLLQPLTAGKDDDLVDVALDMMKQIRTKADLGLDRGGAGGTATTKTRRTVTELLRLYGGWQALPSTKQWITDQLC